MEYRIVVVDDEALSLTNARTLLGDANMKVSCLKSGQDLLKFVVKNSPDLILLDILRPGMDGFETYHALREFEDKAGRKHIPVIFLTGENDSETEQRGLKAGASDFIRKPFNKDILVSRIEKTIANSKTIMDLTTEATVDKLTGFLNKASGTETIARLCSIGEGSLVVMDLDSFKLVNDLFGHDMGDKVLQGFADIVRRNVRESDVVSRIGGDEFMAFFPAITDAAFPASLFERLNSQLTQEAVRLMGEDNGIPLGVSLGVVMIPKHGREYEQLFAKADGQLYTVKQNGKHGFSIYENQGTENLTLQQEKDLALEIERITKTVEERNDIGEAVFYGGEAFATAYQSLVRYLKQSGGRATRLLLSLTLEKETAEGSFADQCNRFGNLLQKELRRSDMILQAGMNRFFVFLPGCGQEEAAARAKQVMAAWRETDAAEGIRSEYACKADTFS